MASTMSSTPRMPFGEISGARLQNLTSLKNRQNAILSSPSTVKSSTKRTIQSFQDDVDSENIDPSNYSPKRSKGSCDFVKPSNHFILTKKTCSPASPTSRSILKAHTPRTSAPASMSTTTITSPLKTLSAPAGRSPTRKRSGILNRRRTIQRVEPPSFTLSSTPTAPFSIAAALSGTISSYNPRNPAPFVSKSSRAAAWDFVIHEDTKEDEAQILMEHGACTLDLSSDDEVMGKLKAEMGSNKENVAPEDDVSQTHARAARPLPADAGKSKACMDCDRKPLGEVDVLELYGELDEEHVEVDENPQDESAQSENAIVENVKPVIELPVEVPARKAALLEPIEKADEGFEVWESASAKDE